MQFEFIFYIVRKIHARDTHINAHHPHRIYGQRSQSNTKKEHRVIASLAFVCENMCIYNMDKTYSNIVDNNNEKQIVLFDDVLSSFFICPDELYV